MYLGHTDSRGGVRCVCGGEALCAVGASDGLEPGRLVERQYQAKGIARFAISQFGRLRQSRELARVPRMVGKKSRHGGRSQRSAGVQSYSAVHPKKLFISALSKLRTDPEVDLRRAELERAFRKYGGPSGAVSVIVPKDSTFAFVECHSEHLADLAVMEMGDRYRVNKARRTKHEALLEERAAKEAAEKGEVKESTEWDS